MSSFAPAPAPAPAPATIPVTLADPSPILAYADPLSSYRADPPRRSRILRLIITAPALLVPFVAFVAHISPFDAFGIFYGEVIVDRRVEPYHMLVILALGLAWPLLMWCLNLRLAASCRVTRV